MTILAVGAGFGIMVQNTVQFELFDMVGDIYFFEAGLITHL